MNYLFSYELLYSIKKYSILLWTIVISHELLYSIMNYYIVNLLSYLMKDCIILWTLYFLINYCVISWTIAFTYELLYSIMNYYILSWSTIFYHELLHSGKNNIIPETRAILFSHELLCCFMIGSRSSLWSTMHRTSLVCCEECLDTV